MSKKEIIKKAEQFFKDNAMSYIGVQGTHLDKTDFMNFINNYIPESPSTPSSKVGEALKERFKEIWIREQGDLKTDQSVSGYYITGLLLEVIDNLKLTSGEGKDVNNISQKGEQC